MRLTAMLSALAREVAMDVLGVIAGESCVHHGDHALDRVKGPACSACCERLSREGRRLRCASCSAPLERAGSELQAECRSCRQARGRLVIVTAPRGHEGVARSLVLALKGARRQHVAAALADVTAADAAAADAIDRADILVPVPADPRRRRERGFDHAALLARELAARAPGRACVVQALAVRAGERQARRSGASRRAALAGTMRVRPLARFRVRGRRVLIIDDVVTTGATVREAARALLQAGAASVEALACTRARGPGSTVTLPRIRRGR